MSSNAPALIPCAGCGILFPISDLIETSDGPMCDGCELEHFDSVRSAFLDDIERGYIDCYGF